MSVSPRARAEDALKAFIQNRITGAPGSSLTTSGFTVEAAHDAIDFALPCAVIECPRVQEIADQSGWYTADVVIHVFTAMDEELDDEERPGEVLTAARLYEARVNQLVGIMNELIYIGLDPLNFPAEGVDERLVIDFTAFGLCFTEETGDQEDSHFFGQLKYELACMPFDTANRSVVVATGTTTPDVTGDYTRRGTFSGRDVYGMVGVDASSTYWLWTTGAKWILQGSDQFPNAAAPLWERVSTNTVDPAGVYTPVTPAAGELTIVRG